MYDIVTDLSWNDLLTRAKNFGYTGYDLPYIEVLWGAYKGGDFMNKKWLHMVAFVLVVVGGINWGVFGLFNKDLVEILFSAVPTVAEVIYVLIGIAAVYLAVTHTSDCKVCSAK